MNARTTCSHCGTEHEAASRRCPICRHVPYTCPLCGATGTEQPSEETGQIHCPRCHLQFDPLDRPGASLEAVGETFPWLRSSTRGEAGAAPDAARHCPYCAHALPPDAVLCLRCGYDLRTGTRRKTVVEVDQDAVPEDFDAVPEDFAEFAPDRETSDQWEASYADPPVVFACVVLIACVLGLLWNLRVGRPVTPASWPWWASLCLIGAPASAVGLYACVSLIPAEGWTSRGAPEDRPVFFGIWTAAYLGLSVVGLVLYAGSILLAVFGPDLPPEAPRPSVPAVLTRLLLSLGSVYLLFELRWGKPLAWFLIQVAWGVSILMTLGQFSGTGFLPMALAVETVVYGFCWVNLYTEDVRAFCGID